jgi:hypothetical protein
MHYLLLIYDESGAYDSLTSEEREALYAEYGRLSGDLVAHGAFVGANQLEPVSTARTVRVRNGERMVTDGPFTETKETLGGYYLIDVASMEEALDWAARIPSARFGPVEVRPVRGM